MSEPLARRATEDDVGGIERLVATAFGKYVERIGKAPAPMVADYTELIGTSRVWVLEDHREIVGVLVTRAESDHLLLDSIAVSPTAQGGGLGARLLARADQDARDQGLPEVRLCTNEMMTENLDYYPRRGYVETGRGVQDGYRRVFFTKRLGAKSST